MAEPDFTNSDMMTSLDDVIKREPSPIPDLLAGQSSVKMDAPNGEYTGCNEYDYSLDPDLPMIPEAETPKPKKPELENNIGYRPELYTDADLEAVQVDGRCPPNWPLAHLWPVYVGNFPCSNENQCYKAIRHYFASKGLLVHWFFQLEDDYHRTFQRKANLYDGLVYFGSEEDATIALEFDHTIHNGYTLNVFPGRDPIYFPSDRSAMFRDIRSGHVYSEEFFARALTARYGGVRCVVKYDTKNGAVEFYSVDQKQKLFSKERQFPPVFVGRQTLQKQRFVEANIQHQITAHLGQNPNTFKMNQSDPIFRKLKMGVLPNPLPSPAPVIQPVRRGPSKFQQKKKFQNKLKRMRRLIERGFAEGRDPNPSRYLSKVDKKRFRNMCDEVKNEQGW